MRNSEQISTAATTCSTDAARQSASSCRQPNTSQRDLRTTRRYYSKWQFIFSYSLDAFGSITSTAAYRRGDSQRHSDGRLSGRSGCDRANTGHGYPQDATLTTPVDGSTPVAPEPVDGVQMRAFSITRSAKLLFGCQMEGLPTVLDRPSIVRAKHGPHRRALCLRTRCRSRLVQPKWLPVVLRSRILQRQSTSGSMASRFSSHEKCLDQ